MKSYIFLNKLALALSMLFVLSNTSCTKEESTVKPSVQASSTGLIQITGSQDAGSTLKSTLNGNSTWWVATTDKVGIYSPEARTATGGLGTLGIVNAEYTANTTGAQSSFTGAAAMYWGAPSTTHNFYAYYPWTTGSPLSTVVPVTLSASQTQPSGADNTHVGLLDFMVATPTVVMSPANTDAIANEVNLKYNHLFTILEFNIRGTGTIKAIRFTAPTNAIAFSGGTIDITLPPPYTILNQSGTTTTVDLTLTTPATLSATDTKFYMVINPGTQTGNCTIGLSANGTDFTNISKAAPTGGFVRGKKYTIAIAADGDGNYYNAVTIGTQVWMSENLKTTKYANGDAIPNVTGNTAWDDLITGAYCDYENTPSNSTTYGRLYNWFAVVDGRKLCPTGWHVPSDAEWTTLTTFLGESDAGSKMKESGNTHWTTFNADATNSSGFSGLPGGWRYPGATFGGLNTLGSWFSSTQDIDFPAQAWYRDLSNTIATVNRGSYAVYGASVRCVRD